MNNTTLDGVMMSYNVLPAATHLGVFRSGKLQTVMALTIAAALCIPVTVHSNGNDQIRIVANSACADGEEACATQANTYCGSKVNKYSPYED